MNSNNTKSVKGKGQSNNKAKRGRGRPSLFGFEKFAIGTTKLFPIAKANSACVSAFLFAKRRGAGMRFKSQRLDKTVRISRTA